MPSWACARGLSSRAVWFRGSRRENPGVSLVSHVSGTAYLRRMAEYILELYVSRGDPTAVAAGAERAQAAAEVLTREGTPVRYVRAIFVPEDETCFFLYEAGSADAVREAAARAGLGAERVTEALGAHDRPEQCTTGVVTCS